MLALRHVLAALFVSFGALVYSVAQAAEDNPARLLSEGTVAYLGVTDPAPLLDAALSDDLYAVLRQIPQVRQSYDSKEFRQLAEVVKVLEDRLGTTWQQATRDVLGGGLHLGLDLRTQSLVLIVQAQKPETLAALNKELLSLIETDATSHGKKSPVKSETYQGVRGWALGGDVCHAIVDNLLIVSNKPDGLKAVIDRHADRESRGLAGDKDFQAARERSAPGAAAWGMVNITALRLIPGASAVFEGGKNNPLVEFLAAGLLDAASRAPYAAASLAVKEGRVSLQLRMPHDPAKTTESRRWYLATDPKRQAPTPLRPKGTIANLVVYRDMAGYWAARDKLFSEQDSVGFTKADTALGLFFSGRDFGPEVLGELAPHWQLVVAEREFAAGEPVPAVRLPAFALVLEVRDEKFGPALLLAYQNIVSIINLTGINTGRPQMLLTTEPYHGAPLSTGKRVILGDVAMQNAAIDYNFAVSCALAKNRFIIGSTPQITRDLIDLLDQDENRGTIADNLLLSIDGAALRQAFVDNRDVLVSRYQLAQGQTAEAANKAIDHLFDVGQLLENLAVRLTPADGWLELAIEMGLK